MAMMFSSGTSAWNKVLGGSQFAHVGNVPCACSGRTWSCSKVTNITVRPSCRVQRIFKTLPPGAEDAARFRLAQKLWMVGKAGEPITSCHQ